MHTRIITLTAARTYIGQHTIEIPSWCWNDRFRGIVANGGATARILSDRMVFGRLQGTGLALPLVSDTKDQSIQVDFPLTELADALRADGLMF
jgi:hypothetical protein